MITLLLNIVEGKDRAGTGQVLLFHLVPVADRSCDVQIIVDVGGDVFDRPRQNPLDQKILRQLRQLFREGV